MTADDTSAISSGQSYPARPCCSLRGTITVVTVAAVVAVAALTLSIALVPSFNALEDIANNGALAVLADAQDQTRDFFNAPIDAANALRNFTYRQAWQSPSLDSTVAQTYMDYIVAVTRPGRLTAAVWFTDNTRILSIFDQLVNGDSISQVQLGLPTPDQQNYTVVTMASFEQNLTMMSPALVGQLLDQGVLAAFPYSFVRAGPLWAGLLRPCANGTSPFFLGIQAKADYHGRGTTLSVTYVVPLRQKNDQPGNPFAVCVLTLSVAAINAFLAKATFPGATILAYTSLGTLIASSDNDRVPTAQTHFQASSRDSVPSNCMTDDTFTPANAQPSNGTWYMCVMQLSDYPEEGVSSAATQDFAFSSAPTVVRLTAGGVVYITASAPVPIQYPGASVHLLVTIKESIITGNVVDARNIAIGVTAAAIVVIAIASFFLVTVLLKPLTTVAARMELAARLDTDVEAMVPSSMSEVRALQNSFDAMSTELARIRSFVPHSVTAQAAHEDVPCELLYDAEVESTCTASDYSRSQRERSVGSKNAAAANTFLTSRQLNIALGLTSSSIAVVVANCEGFLPKVLAASRDDATTSIANLVHWLVDTVNAHGGVLSSFHGDHFVATFNAAKSCTQSSRRAVAVALAIANRDPLPSVVDCPMTVGVASGRCLVGNVGCVGAMNFAAIGAPYTQATILQRLNRYYDTTVLSTHRTMRNVDTWFKTHVLDIINMPTDTHHRRAVLIGSILEPNERPHDGDVEGFYIVSEDGAEDAEARREEVFEHLVKGRYQQALSAYARLVSRWQRTGCQVNDKTLERLVASARALLTTDAPQTQIFTDLGAYYSLCICRPPRASESTSDS